jgi:hypothetical protein
MLSKTDENGFGAASRCVLVDGQRLKTAPIRFLFSRTADGKSNKI